jgi:large subunit ribosomal protein L30
VEATVAAKLLVKRGRLVGDTAVNDAYLKSNTSFQSVNSFANALVAGKTSLAGVPGLKPVLRLHPPRGGYEGTKRGYRDGGSLGYRGKDINKLLQRMLGPGES